MSAIMQCPSCGSDSPGIRGMSMGVFCANPWHPVNAGIGVVTFIEHRHHRERPLSPWELREMLSTLFKQIGDASTATLAAINVNTGETFSIRGVEREPNEFAGATYWLKIEEN